MSIQYVDNHSSLQQKSCRNNRNNPLRNKQYGFHSSRSTADDLSLHININEVLDNKFIILALDIAKLLTKYIIESWYTNFPAITSLEEISQLSNPSYKIGPWKPLFMASFFRLMRSRQVFPKVLSSIIYSFRFTLTICLRTFLDH